MNYSAVSYIIKSSKVVNNNKKSSSILFSYKHGHCAIVSFFPFYYHNSVYAHGKPICEYAIRRLHKLVEKHIRICFWHGWKISNNLHTKVVWFVVAVILYFDSYMHILKKKRTESYNLNQIAWKMMYLLGYCGIQTIAFFKKTRCIFVCDLFKEHLFGLTNKYTVFSLSQCTRNFFFFFCYYKSWNIWVENN